MAQSAAPAGARPVRQHHLVPPRTAIVRSTVTFRRCAAQVISSLVIFAVGDLRVGGCRP